ncbi:MAG TPA: cytochrome b N-terminal domain-containing protein [Tepidisphaeraceae bacterium]|nr:cytochrome b N-terminal domain-containing protein [Tepidisphaeraceae bacterium]
MAAVVRWMIDRFGMREVRDHVLHRRVPKDPWYQGDGEAMLLLFAIQLLTGIVLAFSYTPSVVEAYNSIRHITFEQKLGWFVRGLHYWSGGLWVFILFWHLMRQIATGGYKKPREGTWLIGVLLLFLVVVMSFLGYLLRWDERAIYALRVALSIFHQVPWIGEQLVLIIQGGPELSSLTLTRLYAVHVVLGPILLAVLIAYHVYLVVLHGTLASAEMKEPLETVAEQKEVYERQARHPYRGERFFPDTVVRLSPIPLATLAVVIALTLAFGPAKLFPQGVGTDATFPKEEWWFAWYSALAALLPPSVAGYFHWLFPVVLFVALAALPFVDRWTDNRGARNRPIAVTVVCLVVLAVLYLTALRLRSPWTAWPRKTPPAVPVGVMLTERTERGRVLFATYGCNSCHAVAGDGPEFAPDMARLRQRYSLEGIRRYVMDPPAGVAMPSYRERMPEEELTLVAEFCHVAQTFPRGR